MLKAMQRPWVCPTPRSSGCGAVSALLCLSVALPGGAGRGVWAQPVLQQPSRSGDRVCARPGRDGTVSSRQQQPGLRGLRAAPGAERRLRPARPGPWMRLHGSSRAPAIGLGFPLAYGLSTVWCNRVSMEGN